MKTTQPARLGVLGGMGPLATADFLKKLIEATPATADEEHIPVIVYSVPQIPGRPAAILAGGPSPLPAMLEGVHTLKNAGAQAIAIPCNTAHYWYDALVRDGGVPIIHIAEAVCTALSSRAVRARTLGLIATKGTVAAGFFQSQLGAEGYRLILSTARDQDECVLPAIEAVKRNALASAHPLAIEACSRLLERGADAVVLACTETPLAIDYAAHPVQAQCVDATRALASACVTWWQSAH
jgi:aspartate racemase